MGIFLGMNPSGELNPLTEATSLACTAADEGDNVDMRPDTASQCRALMRVTSQLPLCQANCRQTHHLSHSGSLESVFLQLPIPTPSTIDTTPPAGDLPMGKGRTWPFWPGFLQDGWAGLSQGSETLGLSSEKQGAALQKVLCRQRPFSPSHPAARRPRK